MAIQPENQTLASVTFQNYFRMYKKLAGMTGTAATEAEEFGNIYGLEVTEVPTNLPVTPPRRGRRGLPDRRGEVQGDHPRDPRGGREGPADPRRHHLDREIRASRRAPAQGRLQGFRRFSTPATTSRKPASSPRPARPGAITIATNMAGRGTDIQLGGNADMRVAEELADVPSPVRSATARRSRHPRRRRSA